MKPLKKTSKSKSGDEPSRGARYMRRLREKRKAEGKKQITVHLSVEALEVLNQRSKSSGLDWGRTLDAILLGHIKLQNKNPSKKSHRIDVADIFDDSIQHVDA